MTTSHQKYQHWNTDTYTPVNLAEYRRDLAEIEQHEPDFGRYEPDLLFPPDYRLDADLDPYFPYRPSNAAKAPQLPDPFYYQAQGQDVPQKASQAYQGGRWSFRAVLCWILFWVAVAEIVMLVMGY